MSCVCAKVDSVPWSAFEDYVRIMCDKLPSDIAQFHIRAAAIEWANETQMLQRDIYVDVQECVRDYTVTADDGYVLRSIRDVRYDPEGNGGYNLYPVQRVLAHDLRYAQYYFDHVSQIMIGESPNEDMKEALFIQAVVVPTPESCEIDRWVFDRFAEHIATGALSRAYLMNGTPWQNPRDGGIMLRRWSTFLGRDKAERVKGGTSGPTFMKIPRWI